MASGDVLPPQLPGSPSGMQAVCFNAVSLVDHDVYATWQASWEGGGGQRACRSPTVGYKVQGLQDQMTRFGTESLRSFRIEGKWKSLEAGPPETAAEFACA